MSKLNQIYKCNVCGNMVELIHVGGGELVCCGQPMESKIENSVDASHEKHVPVIEKTEKGIIVKVGSVAHPMEDDHYIEWIEVIMNNGRTLRVRLNPGEKPEAMFCASAPIVNARAYCNLHGLWINS